MAYNFELNTNTSFSLGSFDDTVFRGDVNSNVKVYYNYEILGTNSDLSTRVQETVYLDYTSIDIVQTLIPRADGTSYWSPALNTSSTYYDHGEYYSPKLIVQVLPENWWSWNPLKPYDQSVCYWPHVLNAYETPVSSNTVLLETIVTEETSETTRKVKGIFREILGQRITSIAGSIKLGGCIFLYDVNAYEDVLVTKDTSDDVFNVYFNKYIYINPTAATFTDESDITVNITNTNPTYFDSYIELVRADDRTLPIISRQRLGSQFSTLSYALSWYNPEEDEDEVNTAARQRLYEYLVDSDYGDCYLQVGYCSAHGEPYTISAVKVQIRLAESANGFVEGLLPNITCSVVDENPTTIALTGDASHIVRYYSNARATMSAEGVKGAGIVSTAILTSNATLYGDSYLFESISDGSITFQATDTRGHTALAVDDDMVFLKYVRPTCNMTNISLPQPDDTCHVYASGMYWDNSFGAVDNELTFWYRYKSTSISDYVEWAQARNLVFEDADGNNYNAEFDVDLPNHVDAFTIQVMAMDKLGSGASGERTVRAYPIFDWSENDFHFNIPVNIDGDLVVSGTITSNTPVEQTIEPEDYIVEQGTRTTGTGNATANWVYRKWNSGVAECWCRKHIQTGVSTAWGGLYVSGALPHTNILWPVNFIDIPVANITIAPNASGAFLIAGGSTNLTATNTGGYEIARGTSLSSGNFYINYYGIGQWK